jgi:glycosyltransferase involved in cell wall biosynthesis
MQLTAVSPYGAGGASTRVRVYDWLRHLGLTARRYEYIGAPANRPRILAANPRGVADAERRLRDLAASGSRTMLLQREASPLSRGRIETSLLRSAAYGVYDFDDALHLDHGGSNLFRRLAPKAAKCQAAATAADWVIVGNDLLAEWVSQWAGNVVVIPSCVEPDDYVWKTSYALHDPPRIGWLGSPSTEHHLSLAATGLRELHERTGARLRVISSGLGPVRHLDEMVDRVPWDIDDVAAELESWDVAIAPLQDTAFARGKCAYKVLQYGATGLPVVGSPVGVNREVLAGFGCPAVTPGEWGEALELLLSDHGAREQAGTTAREHVATRWSYEAWASTWLDIIDPDATVRRAGDDE